MKGGYTPEHFDIHLGHFYRFLPQRNHFNCELTPILFIASYCNHRSVMVWLFLLKVAKQYTQQCALFVPPQFDQIVVTAVTLVEAFQSLHTSRIIAPNFLNVSGNSQILVFPSTQTATKQPVCLVETVLWSALIILSHNIYYLSSHE